jgi:hypothetical protein
MPASLFLGGHFLQVVCIFIGNVVIGGFIFEFDH